MSNFRKSRTDVDDMSVYNDVYDEARQFTNGPRISTSSYIHMLWLTLARGYKVRLKTSVPKARLFGNVGYTHHWVLEGKWQELG